MGALRRRFRGPGDEYIQRAALLLALLSKYSCLGPKDAVLELGTGWVHWYGIVVRLAYECRVDLMDVVDNRQLSATKRFARRMGQQLSWRDDRQDEAARLVEEIAAADSFSTIYDLLGARYFLIPDGDLRHMPDNSYSTLLSFHVLEHVGRSQIVDSLKNYFRILKPGGISIHQIGIDDHVSHHVRSAHPKQYLMFDDAEWRATFESDVKYFNRVQREQWLETFASAGFELLEVRQESCSLDGLPIATTYAEFSDEDLTCTILTIVHRRP